MEFAKVEIPRLPGVPCNDAEAQPADVGRRVFQSEDEAIRYWAIHGLQELNTPEARQVLFDAGVRKGAVQPGVAADDRVGRSAPSRVRR